MDNINKLTNNDEIIVITNVKTVEKQVEIFEEEKIIIKYKSKNHNKILKKYKNDKFNIFDD